VPVTPVKNVFYVMLIVLYGEVFQFCTNIRFQMPFSLTSVQTSELLNIRK